MERLFLSRESDHLSLSALATHAGEQKYAASKKYFSAARLEKRKKHTGLNGAGGGPLRVTWGRQQGGQGRTLWQRHHDTHCPKSRGSSSVTCRWNLVAWLDSVKRAPFSFQNFSSILLDELSSFDRFEPHWTEVFRGETFFTVPQN